MFQTIKEVMHEQWRDWEGARQVVGLGAIVLFVYKLSTQLVAYQVLDEITSTVAIGAFIYGTFLSAIVSVILLAVLFILLVVIKGVARHIRQS